MFFNRETTYISDIINTIYTFEKIYIENEKIYSFVISYAADFCWAMAVPLGMYGFLNIERERRVLVLIVPIIGMLTELLQAKGILNGTSDWFDILTYFVGSSMAIAIIKCGGKNNEW